MIHKGTISEMTLQGIRQGFGSLELERGEVQAKCPDGQADSPIQQKLPVQMSGIPDHECHDWESVKRRLSELETRL